MNLWLAAGSLLLIVFLIFLPQPEDKVVFLDVGQGDSILIEDGTQQVLVDGGPGMQVLERLGEEMPWFDRRIEVVVATHPDKDHLEGLLHVLERYDVELVLMPRVPHTSKLYAEWLRQVRELLEARHIQYRFAWEGQRLQLGDAVIDVVSPLAGTDLAAGRSTNNASVVTRVTFHDLTFLLTGDIEVPVERQLVQHQPSQLDVTVLKAGHHGSRTSTSEQFLRATTPAAVIISAGANNTYGHPHEDVLARLAGMEIFRTDQLGSIRFRYADGQWLQSAQREGHPPVRTRTRRESGGLPN